MSTPIAAVVTELAQRGVEVWLIGSRANPDVRPPNDWDLLAIGDRALLDEFRFRPRVENLDLLIVFNGDEFECPWPRPSDGATKSGSLSGWKWQRLNEEEATYEAVKPREGDDFYVDVSIKKAVRIRNAKTHITNTR